jgi:Tfp pilus assembly protein PilF
MIQNFRTLAAGGPRNAPEISAAWAEEGIRRAREGDYLDALRRLQLAVAIDDDCYAAWVGLAKVFGAMKEFGRARRCLSLARAVRGRLGHRDPDRETA